MIKKIMLILIALLLAIQTLSAQILLDENFDDWDEIGYLYTDDSGDNNGNPIDFGEFSAADDSNYLYFYLKVGNEINLQDNNEITLYIDTDNNNTTGTSVSGIGAELEYTFGDRSGTAHLNGNNYNIGHNDIGLVSSPTVTSTVFEIALNKDAKISGNRLFSGSSLKFVVEDENSGGDIIPNENGGISYSFSNNSNGYPKFAMKKQGDEYLRVMTYNVLFDNLFESSKEANYRRIFQTAEPDLIGFCEIYDHTSRQAANKVESFLPLGEGEEWYNSKANPDIIVVSKFPVLESFQIDGNGAFLIDATSKYNTNLLFLVAHPPCCNNNEVRQKEIDHMMGFVRDAMQEGGELTIEEDTPIIIGGDMNLVGYDEQLETFLTGDIIYENLYGSDFTPDWDNSGLEDAKPFTTNTPLTFTWYSPSSGFGPGRLDLIFYTGSVMELENSYTLFTKTLSTDTLTAYNLERGDSESASDHLPLVADFKIIEVTGFEEQAPGTPNGFGLKQNYPNPFNPSTTIVYSIPPTGKKAVASRKTTLKVFNLLGEAVTTLVDKQQKPGNYEIKFNPSDLASGVYFYRLQTGEHTASRKMALIE